MEFIEVTLLGGERLCIRKSVIVLIREFKYFPKELIKEKPFLKDCPGCVALLLSDRQEIYCVDPYSSIVEKLKQA